MDSQGNAILSTWHVVDTSLLRVQMLNAHQAFLRLPHVFKKYSHKSGKTQTRFISLDATGTLLEWHGSGPFATRRSLPLSEITEIVEGNNEFVCSKPRINLRLDPPEVCFMVKSIHGALYLVADNRESRDEWVKALKAVALDKTSQEEFRDIVKRFQEELSGLVEELARLDMKLKNVTLEAQSLREDNQLLKDEMTILKEKLQGKEVEDIKREMEEYYNALMVDKDQELLKHEKTIMNLSWKLQELDTKYTANVYSLESRLLESESKVKQTESDLADFREATKQRLSEAVDAKAGQYLHSNRILTAYVSHLKRTSEDLDKEVSLWKSAVHHFALVQYLEEHQGEDNPSMRDVLKFALDHLEKHYHSISTQRELIDILSQTRSLRSRQTLSLAISSG